jgi:hypothetical protein
MSIGVLMQDMEIHRLSNVDKVSKTAVCSVCGPTKIKLKKHGAKCWTKYKEGRMRWRKSPNAKPPAKQWKSLTRKKRYYSPYRKHAKPFCERCGFVASHPSQIDIHHKDHNHKNDAVDNLVSLCANCHRLIHYEPDTPIDLVKGSEPPIPANPSPSEPLVGMERLVEENMGLKTQIKALLDGAESDSLKIKDLERRLDICSRATEDMKTRFWIAKYNELIKSVSNKHPDE